MAMKTETVVVQERGELTGTDFGGPFVVRTRLSLHDKLVRDQVRRELLGPAGGTPTPDAVALAEMLSQLAIRVQKGPSWWDESAIDGIKGAGLEDNNVLIAVYRAVMKVDEGIVKALAEAEAKAKEELKAQAKGDTE